MGKSRSRLKLFTFFGVLLLVGSLLVGLFQEAQGIEGRIFGPSEAQGVTTYFAEFEIEAGERIPIQSIRATLEKEVNTPPDKVAPEFISEVRCPMQVKGSCVGAELSLLGGTPDVITRIESVGAFSKGLTQTDTGYQIPTGYELPQSQFFTQGPRTATSTGYGYDTVSPVFQDKGYGYGYGYQTGDRSEVDFGEGYGYGYDNGKVHLIFEIDVVGSRLDAGAMYYLTVIAETGSQIVGEATTTGGGTVDVGLVLDRSGSMRGSKIVEAKDSAIDLVDRLDSTDQSGLVSFSSSASLDQPLTTVHQDTKDAIAAISASGGTRIDLGIQASQADFENNGRSGASPLMLVLSDGVSSGSPTAAAETAKDAGIEIFAIAFGSGADRQQLWEIASEPKRDDPFGDQVEGDHFLVAAEDDLSLAFDSIFETILTIKTQKADFSTPWIKFTALRGVGGGGGGGGGAGTAPPSGQQVQVGAGQPFNGQPGAQVTVTQGLPPGVNSVSVNLNAPCNGCSFQFSFSSSPPPGTAGVPTGSNILSYLTVDVVDSNGNPVEGLVNDASIEFDQPSDTNANEVVLLHEDGPGWEYLPTTCSGGSCTAKTGSFSTFAIAVDTAAPSISDVKPTGEILQVKPVISADLMDNRGVDPETFELLIDGEPHGGTTGELTVTEDSFRYVSATDFTVGEHTVEARVQDLSGHETTRSWSFTVSPEACPEGPSILQVRPADGATGVNITTPIEVSVQEGACQIASVILTVNGQEVPATYSDGTATAALPAALSGDAIDARITLQDSVGNTAERSWSYETAGASSEQGLAPAGQDLSTWAWLAVALVVIAAGVGSWYWYDQQQNGGGRGGGGTGGGT